METDRNQMTHSFVITAYGDSPYLESCIKSLVNQSVTSPIKISTSTPSEYIDCLSAKYDIPVVIRPGEPQIAADWNFAYETADSDMVTIAHQDDIYHHDYVKTLLEKKEQYPDMSVFMCSSVSIKGDKLVEWGGIEIVKKLLRTPLRFAGKADSTALKKAAISLGNPVICPSCTYDKNLCGEKLFDEKYSFVLDWDALYKLAENKGRWVCVEKPLIMYRVHTDSATGECLKDDTRAREEEEMFNRLLPKSVANVVRKLYRKSYDAYKE